ncbi:MAG: DUF3810 domain-containing protein [Lachnospiraceae bacterium]|nr:DUF3810 domain-containing protein [Lachnospiraceae bacterium]
MDKVKNGQGKKPHKALKIYGIWSLAVVLVNVAAWTVPGLCDWYIRHIFLLWVNTYGRLMDLFTFSVGEWMLAIGVGLVVIALVLGLVLLVLRIVRGVRSHCRRTPDTGCPVWIRRYYLFFAWTLLAVCTIMTLNCSLLYHASTFSEQYFLDSGEEYTLEQLTEVRNMVVEQCNALAPEMERDENGRILYNGTARDMQEAAIRAMQKLGETYDQLDGYYPHPKPFAASDFFCQQYMQGYFFPFSMEANYNDVMYIMNKPDTFCHELAHLRGYIYEDEANFISFLACIQSEEPIFVYSGYLSVLNYLDNDFYQAIGRDQEAYLAQPRISAQVLEDNVFVTEEEWERINGSALIATQTVDQVSDVLRDTSLKAFGVNDGVLSYNRVVRLLLEWHYYSDLAE